MAVPVVKSAEHTVGWFQECEKVWHSARGCVGLEQMMNEMRSQPTS